MGFFNFLYDQTSKLRKVIPYLGRDDGFEDPANVGVSYDYTTRKITLTHSSGTVAYWHLGFRYTLTSPATTPTGHAATDGNYWLTIGASGAFTWDTVAWDIETETPVAYAYYNSTTGVYFALREVHGLMYWETHKELHEKLGTYRRSGGLLTAGTYTVGAGGDTDVNVTPGTDQVVIADEDLPTTNAAWTQGSYTRLHFISSVATFTQASALPFPVSGGAIQYNSGGTSLVTVANNNRFVNVYVLYLPVTSDAESQKYRTLWMTGQTLFTSLATARAEDFRALNMGDLLSIAPELIPFVQITYGYNAAYGGSGKVRIEANPYYITGSRESLVAISGITPSTHNNLSGRTDADCHPGTAIALTPLRTQAYSDVDASIQHLYDKYPGFTDYEETVAGSSKSDFTLAVELATDHSVDVWVDGRKQLSTSFSKTVANPGHIVLSEAVPVGKAFQARVYTK